MRSLSDLAEWAKRNDEKGRGSEYGHVLGYASSEDGGWVYTMSADKLLEVIVEEGDTLGVDGSENT